jgi:hypothetical protein
MNRFQINHRLCKPPWMQSLASEIPKRKWVPSPPRRKSGAIHALVSVRAACFLLGPAVQLAGLSIRIAAKTMTSRDLGTKVKASGVPPSIAIDFYQDEL